MAALPACVLAGTVLCALASATTAAAADLHNGRQVYRAYCASCHGPTGVAVMPGAPNFARGDRLIQPDAGLLASIRGGRNAMPAFAGVLRDREILDVIAFLRTMR